MNDDENGKFKKFEKKIKKYDDWEQLNDDYYDEDIELEEDLNNSELEQIYKEYDEGLLELFKNARRFITKMLLDGMDTVEIRLKKQILARDLHMCISFKPII